MNDLFLELKTEDPDFKYQGKRMKYVKFSNGQKVLVTLNETVNRHIVKLSIYSMGKKFWSVRFQKKTMSFLVVDSLLTRFYWENINCE